MSIATAVIADTTTPAERPKAFGLFDAAFRMGFVTGPAISFLALKLPRFPGVTSLGMSFFIAAIISLVAVLLTWFMLPETLSEREELRLSWQMFRFGKIFQAARSPKLGRAFVLTFLSGFTFTIFAFSFQPFFLNVLHQDAERLTIMFMLIGVIGVVTQLFAVVPLTKRFNLADIIAVAIAVRAAVFLLIPTFPVLPIFVALACILGITNSFTTPLINAILSTNSTNREQGEVQGINASYLSISNALGPACAGLLVSISYSTPFWVAGILALLTAGFALSLKSIVNCSSRGNT